MLFKGGQKCSHQVKQGLKQTWIKTTADVKQKRRSSAISPQTSDKSVLEVFGNVTYAKISKSKNRSNPLRIHVFFEKGIKKEKPMKTMVANVHRSQAGA